MLANLVKNRRKVTIVGGLSSLGYMGPPARRRGDTAAEPDVVAEVENGKVFNDGQDPRGAPIDTAEGAGSDAEAPGTRGSRRATAAAAAAAAARPSPRAPPSVAASPAAAARLATAAGAAAKLVSGIAAGTSAERGNPSVAQSGPLRAAIAAQKAAVAAEAGNK